MSNLGRILFTLPLAVLLGGAAAWAQQPPAPANGNGMVTFAGGPANKAGFIRITASKPKWNPNTNQWESEDLDVTVPVAVNATGVAVAGGAHTIIANANNGAFAGNVSHAPGGNALLFTGITKLDGNAGKTGIKVFWAVTDNVETDPRGKKIRNRKTGDGGRGGHFSVVGLGATSDGGGGYALEQAIVSIDFAPADTGGAITLRLRDALQAAGWDVTYDPGTDPETIRVDALPSGAKVHHLLITAEYDDQEAPGTYEYHWEVGFQDE